MLRLTGLLTVAALASCSVAPVLPGAAGLRSPAGVVVPDAAVLEVLAAGGSGPLGGPALGPVPTASSPALPGLAALPGVGLPGSATPAQPGSSVGSQASPAATAALAAALRLAFATCEALERREYAVDCLGERLGAVAGDLPAEGDYGAVRAILSDAAAQLDGIVAAAPSPTLPPVVPAAGPLPVAATRPLRPTATEATPQALGQASAVIEEAQTRLLRSGGGSDARAAAFRTVAATLDGGTVLLRSA